MAMKSEVRFANQFLKSFETSPNVTYLKGYTMNSIIEAGDLSILR